MRTCWLALGLLLGICVTQETRAAQVVKPAPGERRLERLEAGGSVYSNVVVSSKTDTDIIFRYEGGILSVKVSELDDETLRALGYIREPKAREGGPASPDAARQLVGEISRAIGSEGSTPAWVAKFWMTLLILVVTAGLIVYIFFVHCLRLICAKASAPAGPLIWLPVVQGIPLLRAAGMPIAWLGVLVFLSVLTSFLAWQGSGLAVFAAVANSLLSLLVWVVWSVKISQACKKSPLFGLLLLIPGVNLVALVYLAFSK
jgi:hypothetical protein